MIFNNNEILVLDLIEKLKEENINSEFYGKLDYLSGRFNILTASILLLKEKDIRKDLNKELRKSIYSILEQNNIELLTNHLNNHSKNSILHFAIESLDVSLIKRILKTDINVNIMNTNGNTPLHYIICDETIAIAKEKIHLSLTPQEDRKEIFKNEDKAIKILELLLLNGADTLLKNDFKNNSFKTLSPFKSRHRSYFLEFEKLLVKYTDPEELINLNINYII